jgi:hypothetical protein
MHRINKNLHQFFTQLKTKNRSYRRTNHTSTTAEYFGSKKPFGAAKPNQRVLMLRYFGFRGKAQFVYLAKPKGPGPRSPRVFKGQRSDRLFFADIQDIVNDRTFGP